MEKFKIKMYDVTDTEVEVEFEINLMKSRWEFTEIVSAAQVRAAGDNFKFSVELAKILFPKMIVSPEFPKTKKVNDVIWTIDTQIKEFFYNDPKALDTVVSNLLGFMRR
ncbi:MAG: hypothetical protein ACRC6U_09265 [Fusobacteriaceae bacterium]